MLTIRLARMGAKKQPHYRVVVIEKTRPRDGRFVEIVGHYNPRTKPAEIHLKPERIAYWLQKGAQPSETVRSFLRRQKTSSEETQPPVA
ncbi:MAG: 30S ribosomal protein S16 [Acidobacteria bacterium]|nr:30S ribosomal protein S16 [Acidobacteriota bacterium]